MHYIILTSYNQPEQTIKAIEALLNQNIKEKFKIIVSDPFSEIEKILKNRFKKEFKTKKIEFFLDPGEGKSYALNIILEKIYSKNNNEIIILTDGDVFVSENAISEILNSFKNKKVGIVTGRPISLDSRKTLFGYFSHLAFDGIHKVREKLSREGKFFECSGYLFAFRNGILQGFPLETSEDAIIPYLFWKKGYKVKYVPKAKVYVLNNYSFKSYIKQKLRNIKAHENLNFLAKDMPRTKSFWNEVKYGTGFALKYPKNLREVFYTLIFFVIRFYVYLKAFFDIKLKKKTYRDGWRAEE